jgi:Domain of unknown function (DUF2017)
VARGFRRTRHGLRARLDAQERGVLAHLFVDVYELLDDGAAADPDPLAAMIGIGTSVDLPDDPALARLLPDAHADDPEASSEFRRYTERGLRDRKRQCLETARLTLGRDGALVLDDAEGQAWLVALTDVRLVLAERMGLRTEDDHEILLRRLGISFDAEDDEDDEDLDADDDLPPDASDDDFDDDTGDHAGASAAGAGALLGQGVDEGLGVPVEETHPRAVDPTSDLEPDDVARAQLAAMLSLYDFLTWLQETLVQAVCDD